MKNIIFCFSGTGNSLYFSRQLAQVMPETDIVLIRYDTNFRFTQTYDRIGFVYPTYFWGMPHIVSNFIESLDFTMVQNAYFFAVTTCGSTEGNALKKAKYLLSTKNIALDYSTVLKMFSNYIVFYPMKENVEEITQNSNEKMKPIIADLINKKLNKTKNSNPIMETYCQMMIKRAFQQDKYFNVNENCVSCKICAKICPAGNIQMQDGKPTFSHKCEQCVSCLQFCPKQAINYKTKTEGRKRYTHPDISYKDLIS